VIMDSNVIEGNQITNCANGINRSSGTNTKFLRNTFADVASPFVGSATLSGEVIEWAPPSGAPAISGCGTVTSQLGNGFVGSFDAGQAACLPVITPGITAVNGFRCSANDVNNPGDTFTQTAKSTTTCTMSATVTSGDVIQFTVFPY
jgi:hypothetical protein